MARKYSELRARMSPEVRKRANRLARNMIAEMPLQELRQARCLSQVQLAQVLRIKQASVSKLERRTDMYIQTLRSYIEAMGGRLEIMAHFPDGDVRINQFEELGENYQEAHGANISPAR